MASFGEVMLNRIFTVAGAMACAASLIYGVLPAYDIIFTPERISWLENSLPDAVLSFYSPGRDYVITKVGLSALTGYWSVGIFCTVLDLFPAVTLQMKTQGSRSYFTAREWMEAVVVSMGNILICSWAATVPLMHLYRKGYLSPTGPNMDESSAFEWPRELVNFALHGIIVDIWFYTTHRILHWPMFYKAIHKFHHRFKAPVAVASMYANPIEFVIGNQMGVILGPLITGCHPYSFYFWAMFSLFQTGGAHSGYHFLGAQNHDWHHEHFNYNFGTKVFMDTLLGTNYEGSPLWMKNEKNASKRGRYEKQSGIAKEKGA